MRYKITIAILIIIMIKEFHKYKYALCATVIYPVMWIFALIGLVIKKSFFLVSPIILVVIVVGYILFCIGFHANTKGISSFQSNKNSITVSTSSFGMELCFIISLGVGMVYLFLMRDFLSLSGFVASLTSIRRGISQNEIRLPFLLNYFSAFVRCTMYYFWAVWLRKRRINTMNGNGGAHDWHLRNRCIILTVLYVIILMTSFSRNSLLFFALPIVFIIFIETKSSNRTIFISFLGLLALFLTFFFWFSQYKASYLFEGRNYWEVSLENLFLYLSGGIVGLDQLLQTGRLSVVCADGVSHTFSLFMSIVDTLFRSNLTPEVVQGGIMIGRGTSTNVYTVYQWTALDFGLIYAVLIQFFLGLLYGYLYKETRKNSIHGTFWYSFLSYSLVMMFFQDQFFSIAQSWFILVLASLAVYYLVFKLKIQLRFSLRRFLE